MFNTKHKPFEKKVFLSSPTMHGKELLYIHDAFETNWLSTVGENINEAERLVAKRVGRKYAVALTTGTAALHLAARLAGVQRGDRVFCSDLTFIATVNPIVYLGGIPVLIDAETQTWNIDPQALEEAFTRYPDVKYVMLVNLFGTPCRYDEIRAVCDRHGAIIIEDAAESFGARYKQTQTGALGDISIVSFNGNKIITGTSGGMLLTDDKAVAAHARKLSTQSRDDAAWYQHSEVGYNYRMSNLVAGVIRGQMDALDDHIALKKAIYERYKQGFAGLPVQMNPFDEANSSPNYWLSCMTVNREAMCVQTRTDSTVSYIKEHGKTCPTEILEAIQTINAEGRPLWKPMHMQPLFAENDFVTVSGGTDVDLFDRGLCLPSDIKMTCEQQERIIEVVRHCFD